MCNSHDCGKFTCISLLSAVDTMYVKVLIDPEVETTGKRIIEKTVTFNKREKFCV